MFEYKLIKSKRNTFSIEIDKNKNISIRAPFWANQNHINELLSNKNNWIKKKFELIDKLNNKKIIHTYNDGDIFYCYGNKFILKFSDLNEMLLKNDNNFIYINEDYKAYAKELIIKWYKQQANKIIISRAYYLAEQLNIAINKVKITNAQTRFGSCSSNKNLNFSWRLIIAPKPIVDYIIIHELAHTIVMNHSKRFWTIVSSMLPNYKIYEDWLKKNYLLFDI